MTDIEKAAIVANYLNASGALIELFLEGQTTESLEAIKRALSTGACLALEGVFPSAGRPELLLRVTYPGGHREHITNVDFVSRLPAH